MGNICRSPTAEGVFRKIVADAGLSDVIETDSAGTHAYHVGEPPDRRAQAAAEKRGYSLSDLRARRVADDDCETFDYVIAMDDDNHYNLRSKADEQYHDRIQLFLDYSKGSETEVPDPYYGGTAGFELVLDMIEDASKGLLAKIQRR
ncbi:MAG: low molecular weight protein-tyrosine-phosphatase, partial [Pseudomonadota bacterium]